jgi:hypothetical protein
MKHKLLYLFVLTTIVAIIIILFISWLFDQPCGKWERPSNVPVSAVWIGGRDGGNWVEFVDIRADTIRFRIYYDRMGDLIFDANFIYENCSDFQLTQANWSEYIVGFDGNNLETCIKSKSDSSRYCQLIPVFPAYYEE